MTTATFQNGSREVTATTGEVSRWEKDDMVRDYIALSFEGAKLDPIAKLYEVIAGSTKDDTISVGDRTFGFQLGICCDSKTKRREASDAVEKLVSSL